MYHRISRKTFDRYIERLSKEQKLTKNQVKWEYEAYLLNNRLAAAEKRGYVFDENAIPQRPARVTQKALNSLQKIKGDVALFDIAEYVNVENISKRALDKLAKKYGDNGIASLTQTEQGEIVVVNTKNAPEKVPKEAPVETPTVETVPSSPEETEPSYPEEPEPEPIEYNDPSEDYYADTDRVSAGDDVMPDVDYSILDNIQTTLFGADYVNDDNPKLFGSNKEIKDEAVAQARSYIYGALAEYGREEVASRLQNSAENVTELVIAICHWFYLNNASKTEANTSSRLHILSEILFANDVSKSMQYDFGS